MSVADLSRKGGTASASDGFTCPHYSPPPGGKRCKDYQDGGTCARPDFFLCSEWEKRNRHRLPTPKASTDKAVATDLFGNPLPEPESNPDGARDRIAAPATKPEPGAPATAATDTDDRPPPRGLTTEDIESFKQLKVEVCLHSDAYGELWLVPAYTGQDRKEITPEHAATICRVVETFPGSRVVSFEKNSDREEETKA